MKLPSADSMGWLAVAISTVALLVSFLTPYYNFLKPFEIKCKLGQEVAIHWAKLEQIPNSSNWSGNLGMYLDIDLQNSSSKPGTVSGLCVVIYREDNAAEKYLLEFLGFRVLDSTKVQWKDSEEKLPFLLRPWERLDRVTKFVYSSDQQFPVSQGIYVIEVLAFIEGHEQAEASAQLRVDFSKDLVDQYAYRRSVQSTTLLGPSVVGYIPPKSRKLSNAEYQLLK